MSDHIQDYIASAWGDTNFADASVIMGQKSWPIHRLVVCKQSRYFEKAFEGHFVEAQTKTINLMDCDFLEEEVDGVLKYLYTRKMDASQIKNAARTFIVADYFQVQELREKAANEAANQLKSLIDKKYFVAYKKLCHTVLGQYPDTDLEAAIIEVIAHNIYVVKYAREAAWGELTTAYPTLAKKVLDVLMPEPPPATAAKRPASEDDFDDTRRAAQLGRQSLGMMCTPSPKASLLLRRRK